MYQVICFSVLFYDVCNGIICINKTDWTIGGLWSAKIGGKYTLLLGVLVATIFTMITPIALENGNLSTAYSVSIECNLRSYAYFLK